MLKENIHQVEQNNSEINTVSASTMPSEESAVWELSRRGLFTAAGACAVSSMVGGCASLIGQPETPSSHSMQVAPWSAFTVI